MDVAASASEHPFRGGPMTLDIDDLRRALADRYAIEREVGRGGMAIVYLAQDVQHHRQVAVKVLPPELIASLGTSRFHHEIEIAARLTHPHILPVYDSGEVAGYLYYVMPFVEGESLRQRLDREGQLPVGDALRIAADVSDALCYAHEHGIVHRDVKPDNILLSSDQAVISDFGIARAVSLAGGERLTQTGMAIGSVMYMSPEQASGDERVDARSDIYALGCVLYEMLAGEPPFIGRTPQAVMARQLMDTLPPLRTVRDTVPPGVERAVSKALSRAPADRFASAAEFASALRTAARRAATTADSPLRGSVPFVTGIFVAYAVLSLLAIQLMMTLTDRFGLSVEFVRGAMVLIPVGLAVLVLTALVQGGVGHEEDMAPVAADPSRRARIRGALERHLTWQRSIGGALLMFTLWGLAAIGWLLAVRTDTSAAAASRLSSAGFDPTRIAVLYFDDFSEAGDLGHIASGLTEALIHEFSLVDDLTVIPRNGVRPYRNAAVSLDSVSRALEVGTLVEGSIVRSGDRVRVIAKIIDTDDMSMTSIQRDRTAGDWLTMIDEIVGDIAHEFRTELGVEVRIRERAVAASNQRAWELVQRAEQRRVNYTPLLMAGDVERAERELLRADSLLSDAQALDPGWLEPLVLRGWVAADMAELLVPTDAGHDPTWISRGLELAEQALERQEEDPRALELRGVLRYRAWQVSEASNCELLAAAERDLVRAVDIDRSLARAWVTLADLYQYAKADFRRARFTAERAFEADAFLANAPEVIMRLATLSLDLEEFDAAIRWAEEGRKRYPGVVGFPALELHILTQGGSPDVAVAWQLVEETVRLSSPRTRELYRSIVEGKMVAVLARAGLQDSARSHLRRVRTRAPDDPKKRLAQEEAHAWLLLGERDSALQALAKYLDANPQDRSYAAKDPWWRDLHGDPRFEALVEAPDAEGPPVCSRPQVA